MVVWGGTVSVRAGSMRAALGMKTGLLMVFFSFPQLMTDTWVTSLPVPAVVGTAIMGRRVSGNGRRPRKYSMASPSARAMAAANLAVSMVLPPPMPTTALTLFSRISFTAPSTPESWGFSSTSEKIAAISGISCRSASTRSRRNRSQTTRQRSAPCSFSTSPSSAILPQPKRMTTGWR